MCAKGVFLFEQQAGSGEGGHRVSYGYYRAFNTMLDHVQVLYNMAVSAAKGNRFKELRKGIH